MALRVEDIPVLGQSPAFIDTLELISRAAPLERPILLIGERGTGKELMAARLHFLSRRWDRPLVQLNCAALPSELLEAELFGVEPGAFTGATRRREGRFERADGGTLFLDEIATLSAAAQEKLLRILEYGTFERLGGEEQLAADVRVVGATNEDLAALVKRGKFRADLLDRLAFDVITLPPLRARGDDVDLLAENFARAFARDLGQPFEGFTADALAAMRRHDWPGNVRELKNAVERAVYRAGAGPVAHLQIDPFASPWRPKPATDISVMTRDAVTSDDEASNATMSARAAESAAPDVTERFDYKARIAAAEKRLLEALLAHCRFNVRQAAGQAGLTYDQLRHALLKHDLLPRGGK